MQVSEISLGTWAFGSEWGTVSDEESYATLNRAVDLGVNFLDTADVYGDGRSERLIARLLKERSSDEIFVATKAGRRLDPHTAEGYSYDNLSRFVERSLENLGVEALDLLQLHCPPTEVYRQYETFEALDRLQAAGKIRNYGVSVEKVEEARMALGYPGVKTVQISFNREGQAFDRGETFSGVDFETGLAAAEELEELVPEGYTLAQLALRWILMHQAVSCAIPGAKRPDQAEDNLAAAEMPPLSEAAMSRVRGIYDRYIRPQVHNQW